MNSLETSIHASEHFLPLETNFFLGIRGKKYTENCFFEIFGNKFDTRYCMCHLLRVRFVPELPFLKILN